MSAAIRLSFNLLLPLILGCGSFTLLYLLTQHFGGNTAVYTGIGAISLLLAILPPAFYHLFLKAQLQSGFAQLDNGSLYLPRELPLRALFGDRIGAWIPFHHQLHTTACLQGKGQRLFVTMKLGVTLGADEEGKRIAARLDEALSRIEQKVQHTIYEASHIDEGMANSLDGSVLLNEDDEAVLKSKFLSALELIDLPGVSFPVTTAGIQLDRNVRKELLQQPPQPECSEDEIPDDETLLLSDDLLKSLGVA